MQAGVVTVGANAVYKIVGMPLDLHIFQVGDRISKLYALAIFLAVGFLIERIAVCQQSGDRCRHFFAVSADFQNLSGNFSKHAAGDVQVFRR